MTSNEVLYSHPPCTRYMTWLQPLASFKSCCRAYLGAHGTHGSVVATNILTATSTATGPLLAWALITRAGWGVRGAALAYVAGAWLRALLDQCMKIIMWGFVWAVIVVQPLHIGGGWVHRCMNAQNLHICTLGCASLEVFVAATVCNSLGSLCLSS